MIIILILLYILLSRFIQYIIHDALILTFVGLPLTILIPVIISMPIISLLSKTFGRLHRDTIEYFVISYFIGIEILYIIIVLLNYFNYIIILKNINLIIYIIVILILIGLIIIRIKKDYKQIMKVEVKEVIVLIALVAYALFWVLISRRNTLFPRLPPDIGGPFDFIQPINRALNYGFYGKTRLGPLIPAVLSVYVSGMPPEGIVWAGTLIIAPIYILGTYILVKRISNNRVIALLASLLVMVLNKGTDLIFHETVIHFYRYSSIMIAFFPLILYVIINNIEEINTQSNNLFKKLMLLIASYMGCTVFIEIILMNIIFTEGIIPVLREVRVLFHVVFYLGLILSMILLNKLYIKNFINIFIVLSGMVFLTTYIYIFAFIVIFMILISQHIFLHHKILRKVATLMYVAIMTAVGFIIIDEKYASILNKMVDIMYISNVFSSSIFSGDKGLFGINYDLSAKVKAINQANIWLINKLIIYTQLGIIVLLHYIKNQSQRKWLFSFSLALNIIYVIYFAPLPYTRYIYRFMELFQAIILSSTVILLVNEIGAKITKIRNYMRTIAVLTIAGLIVLNASIMPFKRSNWKINVLYEYDYDAINFLRANTLESARIISDYYTFRMYTALSNKIWYIEDRMIPYALPRESLQLIYKIKYIFNVNNFVVDPKGYLEEFRHLIYNVKTRISKNPEELKYIDIYVNQLNNNYINNIYIIVTPRTIEWVEKNDLMPIIYAKYPIKNHPLVALFNSFPFLELIYKSSFTYIWRVKINVINSIDVKVVDISDLIKNVTLYLYSPCNYNASSNYVQNKSSSILWITNVSQLKCDNTTWLWNSLIFYLNKNIPLKLEQNNSVLSKSILFTMSVTSLNAFSMFIHLRYNVSQAYLSYKYDIKIDKTLVIIDILNSYYKMYNLNILTERGVNVITIGYIITKDGIFNVTLTVPKIVYICITKE